MTAPTDLSNLLFWYKADAITGLTNGASITTWPDSGPNGWDITTVAGTAPTWHSSVQNSLPAVLFGGAGLLKLPSAALGAFQNKGAGMVYVVINETNNSSGSADILRASTASVGPGRFTWEHTSSQAQIGGRRLDTDSFVQYNDASFSTGTWYIESAYIDWTNNGSASRQNGGTWTTHSSMFSSGGSTSNTASNVIDVGGNSSSSNTYLTGYIAEIFCFDRVLTSTEQAQMDSYLSDRYAITVGDYLGASVSGTDAVTFSGADSTAATIASTESGTLAGSSSLAGTTALSATDSATVGDVSALTVATTDTTTFNDSTSDLAISDSTVEVNFTETSSLGSTAVAGSDTAAFTEVSATSASPDTSDGFSFTDSSALAVLSTSPSSVDFVTVSDTGSLASSTAVATVDGAFLAEFALLVEAALAHESLGQVTVKYNPGVVIIGADE